MRYLILLITTISIQAANSEFSELESKLKKQSKEFITLREKIEHGDKRLGELDVQQGSVRVRIKDMKEECKEFFREESKRIEKIPLLDDAKYKIHGENQLNREHFRGHRLPIEIKSMDMVPH